MSPSMGTVDVGIIGGGVMGASVAYHLSAAGVRVGVLERGVPGQEASGANAGTLAVQNKPLGSIPAILEAVKMWASLADEFGIHVGYERRGGFRVAHGGDQLHALQAQVVEQSKKGVPNELLVGEELHREVQYLDPTISGASFCALDGMANPFSAVQGFLSQALARNAMIWTNCRVLGLEYREGQPFLVKTACGTLECPTIVAASGVWNREIGEFVGLELPIRALVQQASITTSTGPIFPHILTHVRGHLTLKQQGASGKIQIGGGWPGDGSPARGDSTVRRSSLMENLALACQTVPAIRRTHLLRAWTGFEARSPDKLLMAGPAGPEGFFVVGAQSGGFTMSPLAGELIADQILSRTPRVPVDQFRPDRFEGATPVRPRLREPQRMGNN